MFSLQRHPFLLASFWTVILDRMSEVTRILSAIEQGDPHAAELLLPLVYDELRRLAAQKLAQEVPGRPDAPGHRKAWLCCALSGEGRPESR